MPSADANDAAVCSRCRAYMVYVTGTPHPVFTLMQRTTYVCQVCNRTQTYMLSTMPAEVSTPPVMLHDNV
jgi:hypothetical protein